MLIKYYSVFFLFFFLLAENIYPQETQETKTCFGLQFSVLYQDNFIEKNSFTKEINSVSYNIKFRPGWLFGMEARIDLKTLIILQIGFNLYQKYYNVQLDNEPVVINANFTGNEFVFLALAYLRLARRFYMDSSFGFCFDFSPNSSARQYLAFTKLHSIEIAPITDLGFEYRTDKHGIFYLGLKYQRFFTDILKMQVYSSKYNSWQTFYIPANYLAISFKYFFQYKRID